VQVTGGLFFKRDHNMMKRFILFTFLLLSGTFILDVSGQNLVIVYRDGAETLKLVAGIRKCTFSDNNLILNFPDGKTESYALDVIRKIRFSAETTATKPHLPVFDSAFVSIYPNPVGERIHYRNVPEGSVLQLFRVDGTIVMSTVVSDREGYLTARDLSKGIYFLKINNRVFKMIKP
jgi:hypothetical protein